jgi:hypothetical protein
MDDVNKGNNGHNASIKVEMSSGTVMNGYKRYQSAGHYESRKGGGKKGGGKKGRVSEEGVKEYIKKQSQLYFI